MNLLIMGPPGAGKGTQAILIKNMYNLVHISTGEMFRKAYMDKEPLGILAHEYIKKGELVPDDITLSLVEETLKKVPIKQGFILDGFPRTLNQAVKLDEILERLSLKIDAVLNLVISYESLVERIIGRRICKNCQAVYHIHKNEAKS